ncbi:hypothetical protein D3C76_1610220 [compost metagenome]
MQGVASRVAKAPSRKLPPMPLPPAVASRVESPEGRRISSRPARLKQKIHVTSTMVAMNQGLWNWKPQPIQAPDSRRPVMTAASTRNEKMIPAAVARKRSRV